MLRPSADSQRSRAENKVWMFDGGPCVSAVKRFSDALSLERVGSHQILDAHSTTSFPVVY